MQKLQSSLIFCFTFFIFAMVNAAPINSLFHDPNDPVVGKENAPVTIVEFLDYQCTHCDAMGQIINQLLMANANVRIVFKELPILGPISEFASRAALAAHLQDRYYLFSHALLTNKETLTEERVYELAKENGINVAQLIEDMASRKITDQLRRNFQVAQGLQLSGTPTFFIGKSTATDTEKVKKEFGELSLHDLQVAIRDVNKA